MHLQRSLPFLANILELVRSVQLSGFCEVLVLQSFKFSLLGLKVIFYVIKHWKKLRKVILLNVLLLDGLIIFSAIFANVSQ